MDENDFVPKVADMLKTLGDEDLGGLSIDELEERVVRLEAEIGRAKAVIADKKKSRGAAEHVFGG